MKDRSEIENKYKWDLTHLYKDLKEFNEDCDFIKNQIPKIVKYSEKDLSDKNNMFECLELILNATKKLWKLYGYADKLFDQDQTNEEAIILKDQLSDLYTEYSSNLSFLSDRIISFDDITIENLFKDSNLLDDYKFGILNTYDSKKHFLSEPEEKLLSQISDVFSTSDEVYTIFKNTELKHGKFKLQSGEEIDLNSLTFSQLQHSDIREDRENAYAQFYNTYDNFKGTFSKLLFKFIKNDTTFAKVRKYDSSLHSALTSEKIPTSLYENLIKNVSKNIHRYTDYLSLKKDMLGYDELKYYDLNNPIIKGSELEYDYESGKKLVLEATAILGKDYTEIMNDAFNDGWIDVYPNKNKDTGAYMSGSAYDEHPYILLNYDNKFGDVSTLAHELGHAAHSVYSNANQHFDCSSYSTFIAEIASITNEILLFNHMYDNSNDDSEKITILNKYIETFRSTVYRQTMFAEFEKFMYESVENGEVLTASFLNDEYLTLLKKYHTGMSFDDKYANEWARVPHFYYNFYVFQYSTSFIAANMIATRILSGDTEQLEKYKELLKSGGSDFPIALLNKAGVNLEDEKCYDIVFEDFSKKLQLLKELTK